MKIITVNSENLEQEHICCAISNNKDCQVASKKAWLKDRFADGLVFKKGDVRGKCFIEYIPAEAAWMPVEAPGYMAIDCLWVSGQFKGHGYSNELLQECIRDSCEQGKKGLIALSSPKKLGFLADHKYLSYKGFSMADTAAPYFELMVLPFDETAELPHFRAQAKEPHIEEQGFVLYYTAQCPFTAKYVPVIEELAAARGVPFRSVRLTTATQAQASPSPYTTYSLFYNGEFITHEIFSENKFLKLLEQKGL